MIGPKTLEYLHEAIKIYNNLVGRDFLLACQEGKQHPICYLVFRIQKQNFWHLLGCRVIKNKENDYKSDVVYSRCLQGEDVSKFLEYTDKHSNCTDKYQTFMALFDFVGKAKGIRICYTYGTPDQYKFKIASGEYKGIIGYDYDKRNNNYYYPKTTQKKSIAEFGITSMRIIYILSKEIDHTSFNKLEYIVNSSVFSKVIGDLPEEYNSCFRRSEIM